MLIDKLIGRIKELNNPTVVGLDPKIELCPGNILQKNIEKYGNTPKSFAQSFLEFNCGIIDGVCDIVAAVKPQIAMYEPLGADGIDCYAKTIEYAKSKNLIVVGDIKRSDISSTAECYSSAHIGEIILNNNGYSAFKTDFITLNPYLGEDSITPFISDCRQFDKGLFILVKTSNPGSGLFQNLISEGKEIYKHVGSFVDKIGSDFIGNSGYSNIGAVVGATYKKQLKEMRELMPNTFFLIPGYGAQGGKAEDIVDAFDKNGIGAIVNSSRGIIGAHKKENSENFAECAREAALAMKNDISKHVKIKNN